MNIYCKYCHSTIVINNHSIGIWISKSTDKKIPVAHCQECGTFNKIPNDSKIHNTDYNIEVTPRRINCEAKSQGQLDPDSHEILYKNS